MHEEVVFGGPPAEAGERLGRAVCVPGPAEHVDRIERACPDGVRDREEVLLAEAEHVLGVGRGVDVDVRGTGQPPPCRVQLGNRQAVVGEHRAHVGVAVALGPGGRMVASPERDGGEAGSGGCGEPFGEGNPAREGARAQHQIVRSHQESRTSFKTPGAWTAARWSSR